MTERTAISPKRSENFPEWYQAVVKEADLAENSETRGCMVILPYGMALWENLRDVLDKKIKQSGSKNVYFPLLIPLSLLQKEAQHVEGFAKECAVVTHRRLAQNDKGELVPEGELTEPYIIRPTSEMVIGEAFGRWVKSHRDLPLKINQWANVMRWEMRTRLFLRTSEFLWQEGHTVHANADCAMKTTLEMIHMYKDVIENYMAVPVFMGKKSESERFPGADETFTVEAMMQDGKSLQMGTSHFLGQNFAKAQNITFFDKDETSKVCYTTSWGVSTRLIGGLVLAHSDDDGLVTPAKIAPYHISLLPMIKKPEQKEDILNFVYDIKKQLESQTWEGMSIRVEIDDSEKKPVDKYWARIKQGVPFVAEIGPRDMENKSVFMTDRLNRHKKFGMTLEDLYKNFPKMLSDAQAEVFSRAKKKVEDNITEVKSLAEFKTLFSSAEDDGAKNPYVFAFVDDNQTTLDILKEYKATIRCYPEADVNGPKGNCIFSGKTNCSRAYIARSY